MSSYISVEIRHRLQEADGRLCAYCHTSADNTGQPLTNDHIYPRSQNGQTVFENLCRSCRQCNEYKSDQISATDPLTGDIVPLFHPRRDVWGDHFQWNDNSTHLVGLTAVGRATITAYTAAFDTVFESQQTRIVPTPLQAPNANACSERWIRTAREEILDHVLIISEAHLRRALQEFIDFYNSRRPHQSLNQQSPIPRPEPATMGKVERRQILGGVINMP